MTERLHFGNGRYIPQTLEGSFSAVSTPIFTSKYSFCSVFRDLQDYHTFAPLEAQNLRKFLSNVFIFLLKFQQKSRFFSNFRRILHQFQWKFFRISMNNLEHVDKSSDFWISDEFWQNFLNSERISTRILMFKSSIGSVPRRSNFSTLAASSLFYNFGGQQRADDTAFRCAPN